MSSLVQFLYFVAITLAPPGTHTVTVTSANETYRWELDDQGANYSVSQLRPYGKANPSSDAPEHPILTNDVIPDNYVSRDNTVSLITSHDWSAHHILKFDDSHQLEKAPGGYVYAVHIGSNSQKIYSITFKQ